MKRLILYIVLLTAALGAAPLRTEAQNLEKSILRYASDETVKSVFFERAMMLMMSEQAQQRGDRELAQLLKNIQFIRVLNFGARSEPGKELERSVKSDKAFQLVTATNADGQSARVYLRRASRSEGSEGKKELVVFTGNDAEHTVMHLYGAFDLRDVSRITSIR